MVQKNTTASRALRAELDETPVYLVEIMGETYRIKKKFRRLRFMELIVSDPAAALKLVFLPDDAARLFDAEMDENDLEEIMKAISEVLTGGRKN